MSGGWLIQAHQKGTIFCFGYVPNNKKDLAFLSISCPTKGPDDEIRRAAPRLRCARGPGCPHPLRGPDGRRPRTPHTLISVVFLLVFSRSPASVISADESVHSKGVAGQNRGEPRQPQHTSERIPKVGMVSCIDAFPFTVANFSSVIKWHICLLTLIPEYLFWPNCQPQVDIFGK